MECFHKHASLVVLVFTSLLLLTAEAAASSAHAPSSSSAAPRARKLMLNDTGDYWSSSRGAGVGRHSTERMGPDECSEEDVVVYQSNANPLPSGVPAFTVQIVNVCGGCTVSEVHVACGEFASTELVDPAKFQRVGFNDCVVKGGEPMEPSETVSFQYSNSFPYHLNVASVSCE